MKQLLVKQIVKQIFLQRVSDVVSASQCRRRFCIKVHGICRASALLYSVAYTHSIQEGHMMLHAATENFVAVWQHYARLMLLHRMALFLRAAYIFLLF